MGIRKVILEFDSLLAISMIKEQATSHGANGLVRAVRRLQLDWEVEVAQVYPEGNKVADAH